VARAYGPGHPALNTEFVPPKERESRGQCCVTSPVYVEMPGKPIVPNPEDAAYFVHWIDASCEAIRKRRALIEGQGPYGPQMTDEHVQTALDLFARARQVYEKMM
jgi:hypothetical protein